VSPKCIGLELSLLQTFAGAVNDIELNKNGDETLNKAVASAKDPKGTLKQSFLELCNDNDCLTVKKKSYLMSSLIKQRIGEEALSSKDLNPMQPAEAQFRRTVHCAVMVTCKQQGVQLRQMMMEVD
jgi:hypothetical protein